MSSARRRRWTKQGVVGSCSDLTQTVDKVAEVVLLRAALRVKQRGL